MRICVIVGTRPEAIKLAPVILALRARQRVECVVVHTGQHRDLTHDALSAFQLKPDVELGAMVDGQSLAALTARLFTKLDEAFERLAPDWVVVQGDTTSAMVAAVTAFYRKIKIAHVEAGLRTHDRSAPFPEEINRTFIGHLANLHFAPTQLAKENLIAAGTAAEDIEVTGNTVVDAVELLKPSLMDRAHQTGLGADAWPDGGRLLLVTAHRRESLGPGITSICSALLDLVQRFPDISIVFPVHPNPDVRTSVHELLSREPRIHLLEPLPYLDLLALVQRATLVLTDSGGLQEEAPSFGKPILVLREVTERPEVVEVGAARLVGTDRERIVANAAELLTDPAAYARMAGAGNPFGDGYAAPRIMSRIVAGT